MGMRGKQSGKRKGFFWKFLWVGIALFILQVAGVGPVRAQAAQTIDDLEALRAQADYTLYYDGESSTAGSVQYTLALYSEHKLLDSDTDLYEDTTYRLELKEAWGYNPDGTILELVPTHVLFLGATEIEGSTFIDGVYRITASNHGIAVYEVVKKTWQHNREGTLWESESVTDMVVVEVPFLGYAQPALASHESGEYDYGTTIVFQSPEAERYGLYIQRDDKIGSSAYESLGGDTEKSYTLGQDMRFRVWCGNKHYGFSSPVDYEYRVKKYDVTFIVRDKYSGQPIEHATIDGTFFQTPLKTDAEGKATFSGMLSREHNLSVNAGDYYERETFSTNEELRFCPTGEKQQEFIIELEPRYGEISLPMASPASLSATAHGPEVKFKTGQTKRLFNSFSVGVDLPLPGTVTLTYNRDTGKYEGVIGGSIPSLLGEKLPFEEVKEIVKNKSNPKLLKLLNRLPAKFGVDGDVQIIGYLEAEPPKVGESSTDIKITEGYVAVAFSSDLSVSMPVWWIAYTRLAVGGGVQYQSGVLMEQFDEYPLERLTVKGAVQGSLSASIGLGLGLVDTVCVESGLRGEVSVNTALLVSQKEVKDETTIDLTGTWYNKAQFLLFQSQSDLSMKWRLYPQEMNEEKPVEIAASPEPLGRDYAKKDSNFEPEPKQDEPVISNAFPYGQPVVKTVNQKTSSGGSRSVTLLCWVDDARDRNDMNRTALYYSVFDGETYTEPRQVDDDMTADFDPYLAGDGDRVYLVWQNADEQFFDDVSVEDMSAGMGIKIAEWTGNGFSNVTELTEKSDGYQAMPRVLVKDDGVSVVWVENSLNDCTGADGVHTIVRRTYEHGAWKEPGAVHSGLPGLTSLNVADQNGEEYVTYTTLDPNSLLVGENNPSQAIYFVKPESGTSGREFLPSWQGMDIDEPIQESVLDGEGNVYWIRDNAILRKTGGVLAKVNNARSLGVAENAQERVVYWICDSEDVHQLCGARQDKVNGEWEGPFVIYETQEVIRQPQLALLEDGNMLFCCMRAEETEAEMSGQTDLFVSVVEKTPRLLGEAAYLYSQLNSDGEPVPVYVTLSNTGSAPADDAIVELADESGTVYATVNLEQAVEVNGELEIIVETVLPAEPVDLEVHIQKKENPYEVGDVDGNGVTDASDALLVLRHAARLLVLEEEMQNRGDLDGNDVVDAADALEILRIAARLRT